VLPDFWSYTFDVRRSFTARGRIGGLFYFTWGSDAKQPVPYGVYRCGALTDAGKLALKPM
jgi:hypothetical protein